MKPVVNEFGLSERDMNTINGIFKQFPEVQEVLIFGSRAMGNYKFGSDIDLAIMNVVEPQTVRTISGYFSESSLPYFVDLVNVRHLTNPEFIDHIKRNGILFFSQKPIVNPQI